MASNVVARRRAMLFFVLSVAVTGARYATDAHAAGAIAVGKCGAYGYAVKPKIANSLNAATRECYKYGGKECVIRAWACDARG